MISLAAEDYFFKDEFEGVKRFVSLYNLTLKSDTENPGFIEKTEICEWIAGGMATGTGEEIIENRVISEDFFGPWSIKEDDVYPKRHKKNKKGGKGRKRNKKRGKAEEEAQEVQEGGIEEEEPAKTVKRSFVDLKELGINF
jgi:hypothetical protein